MSQDRDLTYRKLSELWGDAKVETLKTDGQKYAIMSDLHMGDGGKADDLRYNKDTLKRALQYYKDKGFTLLLLGDVEELWQFDINQIEDMYGKDIYALLRGFGKNRICRVLGNHDLDWSLKDPIRKEQADPGWAVIALKMADKAGRPAILLVHGHQGSVESDRNSWISRILVRRLWKPLEPIATRLGLYGHPEATKSRIAKNYEQIVYSWAKKQKVIVICGHSHRAIYASMSYIDLMREEIRKLQEEMVKHAGDPKFIDKGNKTTNKLNDEIAEEQKLRREIDPTEDGKIPVPCYFNCGCGLFTDGMTAIEIDNDKIRLVKWHRNPGKGDPFEVYEDGNGKTLTDFINEVRK